MKHCCQRVACSSNCIIAKRPGIPRRQVVHYLSQELLLLLDWQRLELGSSLAVAVLMMKRITRQLIPAKLICFCVARPTLNCKILRSASDSTSDPGRISATVEDRVNSDDIRFDAIINRKREAITQTAVVSKDFGVNTCIRT